MKRIILTLALALLAALGANAQIDSTLVGSNIFATLPAGVKVHQSPAIRSAMFSHVERNATKQFTGFRIRIFNESIQNARGLSSAAEERFSTLYPNIPTYRTYAAPFFKVTVGDFRTRVEAEKALRTIKGDFPEAIIVKERFKYPALEAADLSTPEVLPVESSR